MFPDRKTAIMGGDARVTDELMCEVGEHLNAVTPGHLRVRGWVGEPRRAWWLPVDAKFGGNRSFAWISVARLFPPSFHQEGVGPLPERAFEADEVLTEVFEGFQQT